MCSSISLGKLKNAMTGRHPHIPDEVSPDKLTLVLEPEAAAIYCQNMTLQQRALYCDAPRPFTSKNYLVIDVGGGTVDIVAYRFNTRPEPHMEVIHLPAGHAWGGIKVNLEFEKFLEKIVGDEGFSKYVKTMDKVTNAEHRAHLNELIYETFESQKTIFGNKQLDDDGKISVQLPYTFFEEYRSQLRHNIENTHNNGVRLLGTELRITNAKLKQFYTPVVDGILTCISDVLEGVNVEIDTLYLVGGFGGCHYLHEVVNGRFRERHKYVTPESPDYAVVRGAVLMRKSPQLIQARQVDATYGVRVSIPFEEGKHEEAYRWPVKSTGEIDYQCTNIFSTFVEKGDVVSIQDAFIMSYAPEGLDQERVTVEIYSSPEKDVWYTTGKRPSHSSTTDFADVQKIGELIVPFAKSDSEESDSREVEVMFDFSSTEIQVKGYNSKSKTEVKVVLDFLEG